jgi:hypothetical protein
MVFSFSGLIKSSKLVTSLGGSSSFGSNGSGAPLISKSKVLPGPSASGAVASTAPKGHSSLNIRLYACFFFIYKSIIRTKDHFCLYCLIFTLPSVSMYLLPEGMLLYSA